MLSLSKATYYSVKKHKPSKTEHKRNEIKNNLLTMFYNFSEIYGAPKLYKELVKVNGEEYGSKRTVSVYVNQMGLKSIATPKFKNESKKEQQLPFKIPKVNYLKAYKSDTVHTHVVTDITYIYTVTEG